MTTQHSGSHVPTNTGNIYIGIMSGTSLDGVDVAALRFDNGTPKVIAAHCFALPETLKNKVLTLCQPADNEIDLLGQVDLELAQHFAECTLKLLAKHQIKASEVAAIGCHGQTIRHRPNLGFTLQIGDPNTIAELTGMTTVADFRRRDMAAGGQGAPLVPAFHQHCFQDNTQDRVIVNIGGMANLTLLRADKEQPLQGFDTGPGNVLMDAWIQKTHQLPYDKDGALAAQGQTDNTLLSQLLALPFFQAPPPKSTGREQFNLAWLESHLERLTERLSPEDVQRTLLTLTATSIADAICAQQLAHAEIYLCGGGVHNTHLVDALHALLPEAKCLTSTSCLGLDPDWVEASAFAWLAHQTLQGLTSNAPAVTGARGKRILGAIYQA